ncbi:MAG: histidine triad nucleotide-binding protein [Candidatus Promineifilaceae bacterium]
MTRPFSWVLTHGATLLPLKHLRETATLVAFYHPQPVYETHILLVPKRPYSNLMALDTTDTAFLHDLIQTVQSLVQELGLAQGGYRLVVNGGTFQDVPYLHFHLIADIKRT